MCYLSITAQEEDFSPELFRGETFNEPDSFKFDMFPVIWLLSSGICDFSPLLIPVWLSRYSVCFPRSFLPGEILRKAAGKAVNDRKYFLRTGLSGLQLGNIQIFSCLIMNYKMKLPGLTSWMKTCILCLLTVSRSAVVSGHAFILKNLIIWYKICNKKNDLYSLIQ